MAKRILDIPNLAAKILVFRMILSMVLDWFGSFRFYVPLSKHHIRSFVIEGVRCRSKARVCRPAGSFANYSSYSKFQYLLFSLCYLYIWYEWAHFPIAELLISPKLLSYDISVSKRTERSTMSWRAYLEIPQNYPLSRKRFLLQSHFFNVLLSLHKIWWRFQGMQILFLSTLGSDKRTCKLFAQATTPWQREVVSRNYVMM